MRLALTPNWVERIAAWRFAAFPTSPAISCSTILICSWDKRMSGIVIVINQTEIESGICAQYSQFLTRGVIALHRIDNAINEPAADVGKFAIEKLHAKITASFDQFL